MDGTIFSHEPSYSVQAQISFGIHAEIAVPGQILSVLSLNDEIAVSAKGQIIGASGLSQVSGIKGNRLGCGCRHE